MATSTCHDWRLAAERAGDTLLGDAASKGYDTPLIVVDGTGQYPTATGTAPNGPYDYYWWGGDVQGVNGNANNPGAPIVLNVGGTAASLGASIGTQLVYSAIAPEALPVETIRIDETGPFHSSVRLVGKNMLLALDSRKRRMLSNCPRPIPARYPPDSFSLLVGTVTVATKTCLLLVADDVMPHLLRKGSDVDV